MSNIVRTVLTVLLLGAFAPAQAEQLKAMVADKFSAWQQGSGSPFELLADSMLWQVEGEGPLAGVYNKDTFLQELVLPFNSKLAQPLVPTEAEFYQDGKTVIALFSAEATLHSGEYYSNRYVWVMIFEGNEIVRVHAFLNLPAFERVM
ncbi:ketosteroid isomerase [Alkalimonas collagenimarina]|uniref:Ketosteroid isomerase n=1 Tax=Alkalimonas collagenimarina TaxID=400390 RepID=A0ABT9GVS0_9GAMM|nr:ketosteroid isomerase [Alkalimonas collagenimarina]MDP4535136.1 ketosteroid isomerase [Alkalimonas collagenimarina]